MSSLQVPYHPKENIILLYGCINVPKVGQPDTGGLQSIKSCQWGVDIPHRYKWFPESFVDLFRFPETLARKGMVGHEIASNYIIQLISIWTVILRVPWVSKHSSPKQSAKVFQTLQPDVLHLRRVERMEPSRGSHHDSIPCILEAYFVGRGRHSYQCY